MSLGRILSGDDRTVEACGVLERNGALVICCGGRGVWRGMEGREGGWLSRLVVGLRW